MTMKKPSSASDEGFCLAGEEGLKPKSLLLWGKSVIYAKVYANIPVTVPTMPESSSGSSSNWGRSEPNHDQEDYNIVFFLMSKYSKCYITGRRGSAADQFKLQYIFKAHHENSTKVNKTKEDTTNS